MRKTYRKLLIISSFLILLISCKDEVYINNISKETFKKDYETLSFASKDELVQAIQNGMNGESPEILTKSNNFKSLLSTCDSKTKTSEDQTYYETLGYDTLVPNKAFALLINPKGEIIVNDSVYKITSNGTYYFHKKEKELFNQLYSADSTLCGIYISEGKYKISDGIYRISTFKKEQILDDLTGDSSSDNISQPLSTKASISEPDFDNFPIFNADHHTFFGKLIQNLFGSSKEYNLKFDTNSKRRVKGSFYFYNYGIYSETGVQGWTDKKNWIGWSKTASDELRVGWRNIVLETKIPDYLSESLKGINSTPYVSPNLYINIPGTMQKLNTALMIIPDFEPTLLDKVKTYGSKELYSVLKKKLGKSSDWEKAEALLITTRTHIYTFITNQDVKLYDTKSYTHVFANQCKFMVSINPYSLPGLSNISDIGKWINIIKGTTDLTYPTLKSGEVYSCARFGYEWKGMKIVKK